MTALVRRNPIEVPIPVWTINSSARDYPGRVQHTTRMLNASDGGSEASALTYRTFEIAINKDWTAEALVYNALGQEWTKREDPAATPYDARAGSTRLALL